MIPAGGSAPAVLNNSNESTDLDLDYEALAENMGRFGRVKELARLTAATVAGDYEGACERKIKVRLSYVFCLDI